MLEKSIPSLDEKKKNIEARKAANDLLLDMLISSDMPDDCKIDFKIMQAHRKITDVSSEIIEKIVLEADTPYEAKKVTLEYLTLVTAGLQQFLKSSQMNEENM